MARRGNLGDPPEHLILGNVFQRTGDVCLCRQADPVVITAVREHGSRAGSGPEDFPLPHFQERIADIVDRLEHGLGFVLLRGLPIYDRFSEDEATVIYWGMGAHMGNLVPQNRKGDLIGHIRDLGRRGPYERAYATNEDLGFHTDSIGLVTVRR